MIHTNGQNLYSATELAELIGITKETLGLMAKQANITARRIWRVKYYTEEEFRSLLLLNNQTPEES